MLCCSRIFEFKRTSKDDDPSTTEREIIAVAEPEFSSGVVDDGEDDAWQ